MDIPGFSGFHDPIPHTFLDIIFCCTSAFPSVHATSLPLWHSPKRIHSHLKGSTSSAPVSPASVKRQSEFYVLNFSVDIGYIPIISDFNCRRSGPILLYSGSDAWSALIRACTSSHWKDSVLRQLALIRPLPKIYWILIDKSQILRSFSSSDFV